MEILRDYLEHPLHGTSAQGRETSAQHIEAQKQVRLEFQLKPNF